MSNSRILQTRLNAKIEEVVELKEVIERLLIQNEVLQTRYDKLSELFQAHQIHGWDIDIMNK